MFRTDEGTFEINMTISEADEDILQEVLHRVCKVIENTTLDDPDFLVFTSYIEHDFPTLTTLFLQDERIVIRTESRIESGATYMRVCARSLRPVL